MADISWRYATASDIDRFYGYRPPTTINAAVVTRDGEPMVVIGISRENGTGLFFSEHKEEFEQDLRRIPVWRAIKAIMQIIERYPCPVYAATETEKGHKLLQRLGFTQLDEERYKWISQEQH